MGRTKSAKLGSLVEKFNLEVLRSGKNWEDRQITTEDVNRPGLQLTGFFDYFGEERLQVIGLVETSYLEGRTAQERRDAFDQLFQYDIPALIISRGLEPYRECMEMAEKHDRTVLRTRETTSEFMSTLIAYLKWYLSPSITRHGVLVEIYGEGTLLLGESGIGKSETAIELVKRGHRLIADDAVEIKRNVTDRLVGTAPELIRHYIELRGIGVINVAKLFGMGAIKGENVIDLVINIVPWSNHEIYDRLGLDEQCIDILGVKVPQITIPITPGRNLAVILEAAAMNNRQKKMGYNAAVEFTEQMNKHFDESVGQNF